MASIHGIVEDYFDVNFRVNLVAQSRETGLLESRSFLVFEPPYIIPCEELLQDVVGFLRRNLSYYLNEHDFQPLASGIMSYYGEILQDPTFQETTHSVIIPLEIDLPSISLIGGGQDITEDDDDDPVLREIDEAIEQSMQQLTIVPTPTSKAAISSLKKLRLLKDEIKANTCTICLEGFEEDCEDISAMPCDHFYHHNCIVAWLETSRTCPLCRFEMPTK